MQREIIYLKTTDNILKENKCAMKKIRKRSLLLISFLAFGGVFPL